MDNTIKALIDDIYSTEKDVQNNAYFTLLEITREPVDWVYEVWDQLVESLTHKDNHVRAIASQLLCNLAKSDSNDRILTDFDKLITVTRDEKFVTARHCLQSLWKIGTVGKPQQDRLVNGLVNRYQDCTAEKNATLIRFDIIQGLKNLYDVIPDEAIKQQALALIESEEDPKYRKKYATVWRIQQRG